MIIRNGKLITPPPHDNILEGITLDTVLQMATEDLGLGDVEARTIDRSELYIATEVFMTGTAAHVTPVIEVDRVPIGDGQPGPITKQLQSALLQRHHRTHAAVRRLAHARVFERAGTGMMPSAARLTAAAVSAHLA